MKRTIIILLLLNLTLAALAMATPDKKPHPKSWNIEDVLKQESARSFNISPDGKWTVWVKTRPDVKQDKAVNDLMLTSLIDSVQIQLTRGETSENAPQWSPDGKYIAFTSVRGKGKDKANQIWVMSSKGGEAWQLSTLKKGINSFKWRDNNHLIFTAREDSYQFENALKAKKDNVIVVGDQEHFMPVRLFQIDLKSKKVERLSMNTGKVQEFAISPNGRWIVTNEGQSIHYGYDQRTPPRQFIYDLKDATRKELFTEKKMKPSRFVWQLDNSGFFCTQPLSKSKKDDYINVSILIYFDMATQEHQRVPLKWDWKLGFGGMMMTHEGLLTSLAAGPYQKWALYNKENTWIKTDLTDTRMKNIRFNAASRDGKHLIYTYSEADKSPVIHTALINSARLQDSRKIIELNKWIHKKNIARAEVVYWKGAKGDQVNGILYYPHNYEEGNQYALMASIHGGPTGVDQDAFREGWTNYPNILASRDCFVLKVNYHGSGNHGLDWVDSIREHYYEYEVPDILKGIDHFINKGMVDPDKLGIMGWSNGAILATACVVETNRFKVCAPGAGDVNWTSDYGNCAFGAGFDNAYFGGPPWERPDYYIKKSPLFRMQKVNTPTIIFFGTADTNVPTEQGWEHYRALQQIGRAPVRFLLFPDQPHGLRKITHQRRKMEEEIAWFDRYFFKTYEEANEAFKKGSPLDLALKKTKATRHDGYYGIQKNGTLIPETVENDSLSIGRFEVTRAQYAEFDTHFTFAPSTGNMPVSDITFEKAKAYCRWLSGKVEASYRLPKVSEWKKFSAKASGIAGNSLDYWADYAITPEDAAKLQSKIDELTGNLGLILPVGSFKGVGDDPIFDLEGNVAEWCSLKDGKGVIKGGAAVLPKDKKASYIAPPAAYRGFRVVCDKK